MKENSKPMWKLAISDNLPTPPQQKQEQHSNQNNSQSHQQQTWGIY